MDNRVNQRQLICQVVRQLMKLIQGHRSVLLQKEIIQIYRPTDNFIVFLLTFENHNTHPIYYFPELGLPESHGTQGRDRTCINTLCRTRSTHKALPIKLPGQMRNIYVPHEQLWINIVPKSREHFCSVIYL